jgi:hypothetical protein
VSINFGADKVVNRASVTHLGATGPETVDDLASQSKYFIQAVAYTESLVHNDTAALALARIMPKPAEFYFPQEKKRATGSGSHGTIFSCRRRADIRE